MRYILRACITRNHTDEYVEQLIRACQYANIDEIMMCEDNKWIIATAQSLTAHREMADIMKRAVEKCKESGIRCSFYLKSLVGHTSSRFFALPYAKFVGINNVESPNELCLLDKDFAKYAAELMSYYAECGFESMMIDDDFRSINHCRCEMGCFCDIHVEKTAQRYGKALTRERLINAFQSHDKESIKIRKCHREINFEGQLSFAEGVEKAVHAVDSNVQIGLMASGLVSDQYQGRDIKKLLKAFAGEGRTPFIRPPGGAYEDVLGDGLFVGLDAGLQYRGNLGQDVRYVSEIDVFSPRNIFTKSKKILDLQCRMHALAGYDALTLNIIDHFGTPPMESIEYLDLLKENKAEYAALSKVAQGKKVWGIGVPLPNDYVEKLDEYPWASPWRSGKAVYYLRRLGLPVAYEQTEVNYLTGELFVCYSDEKILELLSKGVILDEQATRLAVERGFSQYIGVSLDREVKEPCFEAFTSAKENGTYANLRFPAYTATIHTTEQVYRLKAENGATVLTEFRNSQGEKMGDCTVYYENSLGGRVLVMGAKFVGDKLFYKGRRRQLHEVVKKLFKGVLPFDVQDAITVAPIWYKGKNGNETVVLYNYGLDEQNFILERNGVLQEMRMEPLSIQSVNLGE